MPNTELRMSKAAIGERGLSFVILRFGVLWFCGSPRRRHRKKIIFKPAEEDPFQTGVGTALDRALQFRFYRARS
jgi:hypothetical protein